MRAINDAMGDVRGRGPTELELCEAAGVAVPCAVGWEPLSRSGSAVYRLHFHPSRGPIRSFVLKEVAPVEFRLHQLICRSLDGMTAGVVRCWEGDASACQKAFLLLEDVNGAGGLAGSNNQISREVFHEALGKLAEIHRHFRLRTTEVDALGVPRAGLLSDWGVDGGARCATAALYLRLLGLTAHAAAIAELGSMLGVQAGLLTSEAGGAESTLLHGDFHAGNLAAGDGLSVRLLDWGEARLGLPVLDLIACGEAEVDFYWQNSQSQGVTPGSERLFYRQLRAAVMCRMWVFLETGIASLLRGDETGIGVAMSACVARLLEAADSPGFRGGRGMQFGESI